jgi:hypothetical protein
MSIASELTRIQNAKNAISSAITNKGVTVPAATKLDGMAALIGQIETGGGATMISGAVSTGAETFTMYYTDESGYHKAESTFGESFTCVKDSLILIEDIYYSNSMTGAEIVYLNTYEEYDSFLEEYVTRADMLIRLKDDKFRVYV